MWDKIKTYTSTNFSSVKDFAVTAPVAMGVGVVAIGGVGFLAARAMYRKAKA